MEESISYRKEIKLPSISELAYGLRTAVQHGRVRSLNLASRWASEQLLGINKANESVVDSEDILHVQAWAIGIPWAERDIIEYAGSMLANAEYQRCAYLLRQFEASSKNRVGSVFKFLAVYSLYMAGEKLREQSIAEKSGEGKSSTFHSACDRNPYLRDILKDLLPYFEAHIRGDDGSIMDGYMMYIFAVVVRDLRKQEMHHMSELRKLPSSYDLFLEAVRMTPLNWSCWLELAAECMGDGSLGLPVPAEDLDESDESSGENNSYFNVMYLFFLSYFHVEKQNGQEALSALAQLVHLLPRSQFVLSQTAQAHYTLLDYDKAEECFERSRETDPHRLEAIDIYSNILYVKDKRAELSTLAHLVVKVRNGIALHVPIESLWHSFAITLG